MRHTLARRSKLKIVFATAMFIASMLACGNNIGAIGTDMQVAPDNVRIAGLPQFVCPSSTPRPTHTALPTQVQPTVYVPGSGYSTLTPVPGYLCVGSSCATNTAPAGGIYLHPAHTHSGATSTARPTYTSYPTPTVYSSTSSYYLGEDVYTDHASPSLALRLRVGDVQIQASRQYPDLQIVVYAVQVENHGANFYVLFPAVQIFVSGLSGRSDTWGASQDAAVEAGMVIAQDALQIDPGETLNFELAAYTPRGTVDSISWILDPYANGFDGQLAGGNVVHWDSGTRANCIGKISGAFTPPPKLTPDPNATATQALKICTGMACATVMP